MMVVVIDYGMGNLGSVCSALRALGTAYKIASSSDAVPAGQPLLLPGVGAFSEAMNRLRERGFVAHIRDSVERGVPILGICLGMQLLAQSSTEGGIAAGLGILKGTVERLELPSPARVPHVGWNSVSSAAGGALFGRVPDNSSFYFDHSYHYVGDSSVVTGYSEEGGVSIVASVQQNNVFAVQFHPEKSQLMGLRVLKNFLMAAGVDLC
jgi:glutamine amidotransferase